MTKKTTIQLYRGIQADIGGITLADGEMAWSTDTHFLYFGQGGLLYRLGPALLFSPPVGALLDHFTDADGTLLTAHVMDTGPGWTAGVGTWQIESDAAGISASAAHAVAFADAGISDGTASVTVTPGASATSTWQLGLALRVQDSANYLLLEWHSDNGGTLFLNKMVGGAMSTIASVIVGGGAVGTPVTLQAVLSGTSIVCSLNGTVQLTETVSDFLTETGFGVYCNDAFGTAAVAALDDFQVTT